MRCRNPLHCIVPPQLLEKLSQHDDPDIAAAARKTLLGTVRLRGQREILGQMFMGNPGGGLRRTIYDAERQFKPDGKKVVRGEDGGSSPDESVNEAFDGLGYTYALYKDIFARDSIDGKGVRLDGVVHYGDEFNNAFWNGSRMVFGDGDKRLFTGFTKAIDVIGHELTHGVTEFTCNLEYHRQSGALNESMSDVFGSLVKQYQTKKDAKSASWLIGEGILGPALKGKALRSMKAPGTAFDGDDQPKDMSDYEETPDTEAGDWGGVHRNSGIPNHAFYLVATTLGGNAWEDAGQIWYDTLLALNSKSDFQDCANMTSLVAGQRFGSGSKQQNAVRDAWKEVGLGPEQGVRAKRPAGRGRRDSELKEALERVIVDLKKVVDICGGE